MGNSYISKIYNDLSGERYYVDILHSMNSKIPEKSKKILLFEPEDLVLRGINNVYKILPYRNIESWNIDTSGNILVLKTNKKELISLKCKNIIDVRKSLYKHIVNSMINMNYSQDRINEACKEFNMEEIYL